jgi:hypothetical protein
MLVPSQKQKLKAPEIPDSRVSVRVGFQRADCAAIKRPLISKCSPADGIAAALAS